MDESDVASPAARKYLKLHLCPGIGSIRFARLLRELGSIDEILTASVGRLASVERIGRNLAERIARHRDGNDAEAELELARERGARVLCLEDAEYPAPLKMIHDPPPCLFVRGTLQPEDAIAVAVVGARHCSHYGAEQAERFGSLLANAGFTVVSGMARGIDAAAHRGALAAGKRTIAVLGCGLRHLYPPDSIELAQSIVESGALISELPMNVGPDAKNFPPRNRIIAGLALGVLVVEAAHRSGALISAHSANEYNREVFAVPGRVDMPHAEGCHNLIKKGEAKLVARLEDILEELGEVGAALLPKPENEREGAPGISQTMISLDETERQVITSLGPEPMSMEAIFEASGIAPGQVAAALTGLQLKGLVRRVAGDHFVRTGE